MIRRGLMPAVAAAAVLGQGGGARATLLKDMSLDQVVAEADRIVVGVVVSQRYARAGGEYVTDNELRVEQTFLGRAETTAWVTTLGSVEGQIIHQVVGAPRLHIGERWLLITTKHRGRNWVVGFSLGAYRVDGERLQLRSEVTLVDDTGRYHAGPLLRASTLADVRAAARRVRP